MSIAVAKVGFFVQGELGWGQVKFQGGTAREPMVFGKSWHCFGPVNAMTPFSGGVSDTMPFFPLPQTESGWSALSEFSKKNRESGRPTFS